MKNYSRSCHSIASNSIASNKADSTYSCFQYLPLNRNEILNYHLNPTDPILQRNQKDRPFKSSMKQTTLSLQKSIIFDLTSKERIQKEYLWKPSVKNNQINYMSYNTYDVYPGKPKPRQNIQNYKPDRNPIIQGDDKSYYIKKQRVRKEFAPVNQIVNF